MALTRAVLEPEVYNEDELFDESSDEEGDLLIQSVFEEEEEEGAKEVKGVKAAMVKEVKVKGGKVKEVKVKQVKEVKVKLEGTTEPKQSIKVEEAETLKEEVKEEVEDSKDDIFNTSQNFMGSAPADAPLEERLKLEPADLNDACFTNIVKREIVEGKPLEPLVLPPGPEMTARSSSSSPTWATIIPLIGGSALGCKEATGSLPSFHLSYSPFAGNEQHIKRYWPEVPFHYLDKQVPQQLQQVDFVNSVCPCAGLSMLNTSTAAGQKRGSDSKANQWMLDSSAFVLARIRPKVLWGENAPGLFTHIGEGVVDRLKQIGRTLGYSFSLIKTSTELHGIPQRRIRTFYFFWQSPTVPMLQYQKRPKKRLLEYLAEIPKTASQQDLFMAEGKASERFRPYQFLLEHTGLTHPQFGKMRGKGTVTTYLEEKNLIEPCIAWLEKNYPGERFWTQRDGTRTHVEYLRHTQEKRSRGLGYWDDSPRFMDEESFAAVMKKTMMWAVHPEEDRFLNAREFMHLMGLPHDFEIGNVNQLNHIAQNVPTCTARDMTEQVLAFLRGDLKMTEYSFLKQDNISRYIVGKEEGSVAPVSVEQLEQMEKEGKLLLQPLPTPVTSSNSEKAVRVKKERRMLTQEEIDAMAEKRRKDMEEMKESRLKEQQRKEEEKEARRTKNLAEREERRQRRSMEIKMEKEERDEMKRMKVEEKEEERKKMKEEMARRREEREKKWAEGREERERKFREEGPEPLDPAEVAEELRKFMCFICHVFPRPESKNRSELYRHYSITHFLNEIKRDFKYAEHGERDPCPECTKPLSKSQFVTHIGQTHKRVEKYIPDDMRLGETSARRSLMTSTQRDQVERLLADEVKVKVKEEVKEEGRRRSARHSMTTRYKQESESESAESDLEEIVVKRGRTEDKQGEGLNALKELETFDFGVKPKPQETKSIKGGLSISIARQKPALKRKTEEEILEIVDSSESEEEEDEVEEVELEEKKTRSGRIIRKPAEVLMPSKKNNAPRRKRQKAESDPDEDNDEDDNITMVGRRRVKEKVMKEGLRGGRRGLRTSARRVRTVDLD